MSASVVSRNTHASMHAACALLILTLVLVSSPGMAEEGDREGTRSPAGAIELPVIDVIATTPLPALGTPIDKVPANVQSLTAEDVEEQNPLDLSEMLLNNIGSVNINAVQNNPFQNDLEYRGFLASPLVGSAIGLSLYMDGVRINEGFGDTVNWDLIPQAAISSVDLIPGSNPLFGLNTLGGAIALRTKSGFAYQGTEVEASGGSFGRWAVEAEHGGYHGGFDWYLTFNALDEDGWRDESPSEIRQLFGKIGWEDDQTDLDLSYIFADNALDGQRLRPRKPARPGSRRGAHLSRRYRQQSEFPESQGQPCLHRCVAAGGQCLLPRVPTRYLEWGCRGPVRR